MSAIINGLSQTRITLYAADGITPTKRYTLQKEDPEGLELSFPREGTTHNLGSGASYARQRNFHGYRPTLKCKWGVAIDPVHQQAGKVVTLLETWTGSAWGASAQVNTAAALADIDDSSCKTPCLVEPHLDKAFSFQAQPPDGHIFALKDLRSVVHTKLDLALEATQLITSMPAWLTL